ncbi:30S ribosomal protein S17 [Candidatus Tremblaya princeps]|uniref:30S ribosomal protein S17 n=1 Tax=Tremblaya princeps TaxID=189385 RepID=A0A143WNQ5_TREPR|nr:30S ribosomal protein S17 [Candidatus Tremblaya princeps]
MARHRHGVVVRKVGPTTAVVALRSIRRHRLYKRRSVVVSRVVAHDPLSATYEGSTATVRECRPMSRMKCWTVVYGA